MLLLSAAIVLVLHRHPGPPPPGPAESLSGGSDTPTVTSEYPGQGLGPPPVIDPTLSPYYDAPPVRQCPTCDTWGVEH